MDKKTKVNTKEVFQFIKGNFEPKEAEELINYLIKKKIDFHQLKNFSKQEKYGQKDLPSLKRIEELQSTLSTIKEIIDKAKKEKKTLTIKSKISFEII